ncbi:hypothetical protein [Aurantimonas sp. Leaf443]|nr:hypothetical protein [Aurantimonas sp. Leaf443]
MTQSRKKTEQTSDKRSTFWSAFVRARSIDASRLVAQANRRSV